MQTEKTTIDALMNLLEDDDRQVSTLAMEELLRLDMQLDKLVAEFQEAPSPVLRGRIHQLGNILNIRRSRSYFIDNVGAGAMPLWEGMLQINYQYNPRMNFEAVAKVMGELVGHLPRRPSTLRMAAFMRSEGFGYTREDILGPDLYLVEDILAQRVGAPVLLAAIAKNLGEHCGWQANIVLYKGKHCLVDNHCNLIEPAEDWRVTPLSGLDKQHPCADKDVWLTVLSQLMLAALMEGSLQAIHRVGSILVELSGGRFDDLPYPLGG